MYKIVRMYQRNGKRSRVIKTGLTLEQAQAHCRDPAKHFLDQVQVTAPSRRQQGLPHGVSDSLRRCRNRNGRLQSLDSIQSHV